MNLLKYGQTLSKRKKLLSISYFTAIEKSKPEQLTKFKKEFIIKERLIPTLLTMFKFNITKRSSNINTI